MIPQVTQRIEYGPIETVWHSAGSHDLDHVPQRERQCFGVRTNAVRYRVRVRLSAFRCVSMRYAVFTLPRKKRDNLSFVSSFRSLRRERSGVRIPSRLPKVPSTYNFALSRALSRNPMCPVCARFAPAPRASIARLGLAERASRRDRQRLSCADSSACAVSCYGCTSNAPTSHMELRGSRVSPLIGDPNTAR